MEKKHQKYCYPSDTVQDRNKTIWDSTRGIWRLIESGILTTAIPPGFNIMGQRLLDGIELIGHK